MTRPRTDSEAEAHGEDIRSGRPVAPGPLYRDAYACVWPTSGGGGTCSHHAPDSCPVCDGSLDDAREADKVRRAAKRAGATR